MTRPIRWIGYRHIDLTRHPKPEQARPIRIAAGAFDEDVPSRDLYLSPDHAVLLDGLLIPVRLLRNDASVVRDTVCDHVTYYHIELDAHDLVLAEGLAAESYLDTGNRGMFDNTATPQLHPMFTNDQARREAESCAPFAAEACRVEPAWRRLVERARRCGWARPKEQEYTDDPGLHVVLGGRVIKPVSKTDNRYVFVLPAGSSAVRLVSCSTVPCEQHPWIDDQRQLGVMVKRILIRSNGDIQAIPLDHPLICDGWWDVEDSGKGMVRWTDGDARLPVANQQTVILELQLAGSLAYPVGQRDPIAGLSPNHDSSAAEERHGENHGGLDAVKRRRADSRLRE